MWDSNGVQEVPAHDGKLLSHKELGGMGGATMVSALNPESIRGWLRNRRGWKRRSNKLIKDFSFGSFRDSIVFVNRVATLADSHDHHPDIDIRYSTVTLTLSTNDPRGITEKDLELAEQIDFATSTH
jgi:4a-hydroxytetrahydrobiopterin dehydratase